MIEEQAIKIYNKFLDLRVTINVVDLLIDNSESISKRLFWTNVKKYLNENYDTKRKSKGVI